MIVLDASLVVELLMNSPEAASLREELVNGREAILAPHLVDIEVASALRRLLRDADGHRTAEAFEDFANLGLIRAPHQSLLPRIWELRHNFTAYDAAYIALAEAHDATLYTADEKLAKGHRAKVMLFKLRD